MRRNIWYSLTVLLFLMLVVFVIWTYPWLPDQVPTHWNIEGAVDAYSDPLTSSLLVPGMLFILSGLMIGIAQYERNTLVAEALIKMSTVLAAFLAALHVVITLIALGYPLVIERYITLFIGILFLIIGRMMYRIPPNGFFGIRTYWTLQNPIVWKEAHELGSHWMVGGGIAIVMIAFLPIAAPYLFFALFATLLLSVAVPMIFAYRRFHQLANG